MEDWTHRLRNPVTVFDVIEVLEDAGPGRSRKLRLLDESGKECTVWLSKRWTSLSKFSRDGVQRIEVMVPDWLAVKTGLVAE